MPAELSIPPIDGVLAARWDPLFFLLTMGQSNKPQPHSTSWHGSVTT